MATPGVTVPVPVTVPGAHGVERIGHAGGMTATCFDALDRHVIAGAADHTALTDGTTTWSYARLLEEVAAFGGVLRHCGVAAGDRVGVTMPEVPEVVVAVLACARIGATHDLGATEAKVVVTASSEGSVLAAADAEVVLVKQVPGAENELVEEHHHDWDVVMRAGRTDPAACVEGATVAPYDERTRAWVEPLLGGGTVELAG